MNAFQTIQQAVDEAVGDFLDTDSKAKTVEVSKFTASVIRQSIMGRMRHVLFGALRRGAVTDPALLELGQLPFCRHNSPGETTENGKKVVTLEMALHFLSRHYSPDVECAMWAIWETVERLNYAFGDPSMGIKSWGVVNEAQKAHECKLGCAIFDGDSYIKKSTDNPRDPEKFCVKCFATTCLTLDLHLFKPYASQWWDVETKQGIAAENSWRVDELAEMQEHGKRMYARLNSQI